MLDEVAGRIAGELEETLTRKKGRSKGRELKNLTAHQKDKRGSGKKPYH
jgi:hypothetical protein